MNLQSFSQNPDKYLLYSNKNGNIEAHKKGIITWLRSNIFQRSNYDLGKVLTSINHIGLDKFSDQEIYAINKHYYAHNTKNPNSQMQAIWTKTLNQHFKAPNNKNTLQPTTAQPSHRPKTKPVQEVVKNQLLPSVNTSPNPTEIHQNKTSTRVDHFPNILHSPPVTKPKDNYLLHEDEIFQVNDVQKTRTLTQVEIDFQKSDIYEWLGNTSDHTWKTFSVTNNSLDNSHPPLKVKVGTWNLMNRCTKAIKDSNGNVQFHCNNPIGKTESDDEYKLRKLAQFEEIKSMIKGQSVENIDVLTFQEVNFFNFGRLLDHQIKTGKRQESTLKSHEKIDLDLYRQFSLMIEKENHS